MYSAFFFRSPMYTRKKKLYNLKNEGVTNKLSPHEISFCSFGSGKRIRWSEWRSKNDKKIVLNKIPKYSRFDEVHLILGIGAHSKFARNRNSYRFASTAEKISTATKKFSNFLLLSFQLTPPLITYFPVWLIGILSASSFAFLCVLSSGRENNQAWVVKPPTTEY